MESRCAADGAMAAWSQTHERSDPASVGRGDASRRLQSQAAVDAAPGNPTYRYHQALILSRAKQSAKALRMLERLLQESPEFPEASEARLLVKDLQG